MNLMDMHNRCNNENDVIFHITSKKWGDVAEIMMVIG
jgi:hypothetical protein